MRHAAWLGLSLLALAAGGATVAAGQSGRMSARTDLDGDGRPERIEVLPKRTPTSGGQQATHYRLGVNGHSLTDPVPSDLGLAELRIVDLDRRDPFKEILVVGGMYPDHFGGRVYAFTSGRLRRVTDTPFIWNSFPGDGSAAAMLSWNGFWSAKGTFRLKRPERRLVLALQRYYPVGVRAKVKRTLRLRSRPERGAEVGRLEPGQQINVRLGERTGERYLVTGPEGQRGWIEESDLVESVEGIVWAG